MSQLKVNSIVDANSGNTTQINGMTPTADSLQGFRNRVINGSMVIDQRNAGASVAGNQSAFAVDRFPIEATQSSKMTAQQNAGSVTPPDGFRNYLGITSSSAYSVVSTDLFTVRQIVEGFNTADLGFGTANAQTVTLSFWVRSSLAGTFSGVIANGTSTRNYPYTYAINAANTWEYKTITVPGDTSGTWGTDNGRGIQVRFTLGVGSNFLGTAGVWTSSEVYGVSGATSLVGTNGATFYITGVQLEAGSVATPFERRPFGTELALCQRYYYRITPSGAANKIGVGYCETTTTTEALTFFPVTMRTAPTALEQSGTAGDYSVRIAGSSITCSAVPTFQDVGVNVANSRFTVSSGLTAGAGCFLRAINANAFLAWSAEL